jgi:hypothetical protein
MPLAKERDEFANPTGPSIEHRIEEHARDRRNVDPFGLRA